MAQKRCSIALDDIQGIIFECVDCGSTTGYPLSKWERIPGRCLNCHRLPVAGGEVEAQIFEEFQTALKQLMHHREKLPFRIRFEVKGLEASTTF